jgi:hypothetical protein
MVRVEMTRFYELTQRVLLIPFVLFALSSACFVGWSAWKWGVSPSGIGMLALWLSIAGGGAWLASRGQYVAVAVLALGFRIMIHLIIGTPHIIDGDPPAYDGLARALAHGQNFPLHLFGADYLAVMPPLYYYVLGSVYALFGSQVPAAFALGTLIDFASAALVFLIAKTLGATRNSALVAASLLLAWPPFVLNSMWPAKEGLVALSVLGGCLILSKSWNDGRNRGATYGLVTALAALTQPGNLLLMFGAPIVLLVRSEKVSWRLPARFIAVVAPVLLLALLPWWYRNWLVTGGFIPLTSSQGLNFFVNAQGVFYVPPQFARLPEAARSSALFHAGLQIIAAHPMHYLVSQAKQVWMSLSLEEDQLWPMLNMRPQPSVAVYAFLPILQVSIAALWAGLAWMVSQKRLHPLLSLLILGSFVHIAVINFWFQFTPRHRIYLIPLALIAIAQLVSAPRKTARMDEGGRSGPQARPQEAGQRLKEGKTTFRESV